MLFFLVIVLLLLLISDGKKNRNESKPFIMNMPDKFLLLELEFKVTNKSQREVTLIRGDQAACLTKEAFGFCCVFQE